MLIGKTDRTVDLKECGSFFLGDFGLEGLVVGVGSGSNNVYLNAGFLGVDLGESFPLFSLLRLEVEIIDVAVAVGVNGLAVTLKLSVRVCCFGRAAGKHGNHHNKSQQQCKMFFH